MVFTGAANCPAFYKNLKAEKPFNQNKKNISIAYSALILTRKYIFQFHLLGFLSFK